MNRAHVLLVGQQQAHRGDLQQPGSGAAAAAETAPLLTRGIGKRTQLIARSRRSRSKRGGKLVALHRLQQITDRATLEGGNRVLIEGSAEDDGGRVLSLPDVTGGFDAIHARHADIQQHHVGLEKPVLFERLSAVRGLADFVTRIARL